MTDRGGKTQQMNRGEKTFQGGWREPYTQKSRGLDMPPGRSVPWGWERRTVWLEVKRQAWSPLLHYDLSITWSPTKDFYRLPFSLSILHKEIPTLGNFLKMARVLGFLQSINSLTTIGRSRIHGTSLAVQRLKLRASTARGAGSIPGWGTKIPQIPHATWCHKKTKQKQKNKIQEATNV